MQSDINAFSVVPLNKPEECAIQFLNKIRKVGNELAGLYIISVEKDRKTGATSTMSSYVALGLYEMALIKGTLEGDIFELMMEEASIVVTDKFAKAFQDRMDKVMFEGEEIPDEEDDDSEDEPEIDA